jgi:adenylosuccinate synthase
VKEKKVFTVTDLGGGDGGKGGVVHKICEEKNAHTVLKVGGAQGSHGVRTSSGKSFNFSQFGCGTFEGVKTHVTSLMVIEPIALLDEANHLAYEKGVSGAHGMITVDENALCATLFHGIASRLKELARKKNPKGTIGMGIGEAKYDSELRPELAIYARDLGKPGLRDKIVAIRDQKRDELAHIADDILYLLPADWSEAGKELDLLYKEDKFIDWMMERLEAFSARIKVVGGDYLASEILSKDGNIVVESSHGILTDRYYGFHPYVSRLRTLPQATYDMLARADYDGQIVRLGVTRGYQIRHGAGPLVTDSPELAEKLLPGSHKAENRYQGKVRVGPLDLVALRYSIDVCGGPASFDGIAVTWFDQIQLEEEWRICDAYAGADDPEFFCPDGRTIKVRCGEDLDQVRRQQRLAERLFKCRPMIDIFRIPKEDNESAGKTCCVTLEEKLGVPVKMISFGPTEDDKVCL